MNRTTIAVVASALFALPMATSAQAGGLSPAQLADAGWTCFNVPNLGVHCAPPGKWPPTDPNVHLSYFFNTTDPQSEDPGFTGTESLMRDDLFNGQPCPTEPSGLWTFLGSLGLGGPDYWACHRSHKER
jgi:hypothetical protein